MRKDQLPPLLDVAIDTALAAGQEIMEVYDGTFSVEYKEDRSPLTVADKRSHMVIMKGLSGTALPILSEEGGAVGSKDRSTWGPYWLVDPLDGTKEFVKRNGEFCVCIALMERDEEPVGPMGGWQPILGVIYAPVQGKLYYGWKGGGAFRATDRATRSGIPAYERIAMSTPLPCEEALSTFTILASRSHRGADTDAYIQQMEAEHGAIALASMGSAMKFGLLAEGSANAYPRHAPTMEWDTAAGQVICEEAGKTLIDLTTNAPMRYNKHELVNNWFIVQ